MFNHLSTQSTGLAQHRSAAADRSEFWLAEFDNYMLTERGLSAATVRGRRWVIRPFLHKMIATGGSPTVLTIRYADAFLKSLGEQDGYSRALCVSRLQVLSLDLIL